MFWREHIVEVHDVFDSGIAIETIIREPWGFGKIILICHLLETMAPLRTAFWHRESSHWCSLFIFSKQRQSMDLFISLLETTGSDKGHGLMVKEEHTKPCARPSPVFGRHHIDALTHIWKTSKRKMRVQSRNMSKRRTCASASDHMLARRLGGGYVCSCLAGRRVSGFVKVSRHPLRLANPLSHDLHLP